MCPKRLYTVCLETVVPVASFGSNCQIPVLIRRCNSGATCGVTSTHITIILELLPKPGDDTGRFQVPRILPAGYVQIPVFQ
ncbi:hypothetical protein TNCV_4313141 [Trichonephila clavipes]|nr:hypothetical protein TNCV_4313141 [Trichonephila clavipes]